jgi:sec-independent protein translocase protein TatA
VGDVGPVELLIVLAIVLLLFGSKKLPQLARSMGEAAHEFRKAMHHIAEDDEQSDPDA